jgi:ABC-type Fe3+-hydroxamate transport system substrate-binding protein
MNIKMNYIFHTVLLCFLLNLTGCASTGSSTSSTTSTTTAAPGESSAVIESALPLIRTGAAVATGAVLDFAVTQSSTRTRLANEMYAAANAVYSLSGGTFPAPAQFQSSILAFGGTQTDASYAQFSTAIAGLYAAYYPKLVTGDSKTATDLLNAIAGGIEDATQAYATTPTGLAATPASF